MSAVSLHSRVQSSIITREDVSARVETALQTYQPVLQEARAIQPLFEITRNSGFGIAQTAELFGRVTNCLADMKPLGEELEKLKAFFRDSLVFHRNDAYQTDDGKRLHPKEWQMHPLTQWGERRDEPLRALFPRFQEIGTIYHELMFENEESGVASLQASLEGIRGSLSSVLFPPSPSSASSSSSSIEPQVTRLDPASSVITNESVDARVETALETYQPVLEEARALHQLFQSTGKPGEFRYLGDPRELLERINTCLNAIKTMGDNESEVASLQASLEGIRGGLSSALFQPLPSFIGNTVTSSSPERSSSPSISSASSSRSSISGVSSEESISVEHQEIQAPASITNPIFKDGWEKLEEIRLGVASGKSWRDLRSTMKSIESDRIRRLVYKAVAKRNGVWDEQTKGSHWGRANWHKTEQKAVLLQAISEVQAQCEVGTIVLINKG